MKKLISDFKDIDTTIIKVMKNGFKFAFILGLLATYILFLYMQNPVSHIAFEIGYSVVKCSLTFFVCFLVGALASDKIQKVRQ